MMGPSPFLPILPAGNLERWLEQHTAGSRRESAPEQCPKADRQAASSSEGHVTGATFDSRVERRKDMPVLRKQSNNNRRNFDFLDNPKAVDDAMANFRNDYYASSSRKPRDALVQTWTKFHKHWFGNDQIVPVTTESLEKVSCLFKIGGYKSYKNYVSRIKELHIESGFVWSQPLQNMARRCTRSVLRGLGGPCRSEAFDLDNVVSYLCRNHVDSGEDGPDSPLAAVVVGAFFLLRELELSAIDMEDVSFTATTVTLNLPVSKVDWQAKGCRRTWSCICGLGRHCPVHILQDHDHKLRSAGHETGPWIPSASGGRCTKAAVVDMIRKSVKASGGSAQDAEGNWIITGHTFRITGARTLSAWGLDPITIQLLGRWGSSAVMGYLAETPLLSFADRMTGNVDRPNLMDSNMVKADDGQPQLALQASDEAAERAAMRGEIAELRACVSELSTLVDGVSITLQNRATREVWWVYNDTSKVLHSSVVDLSTPPSTWKTACGWKFTSQPMITIHRDMPSNSQGRNCPKCLPKDDSSSSSSESS